jgi:hypothetical protein
VHAMSAPTTAIAKRREACSASVTVRSSRDSKRGGQRASVPRVSAGRPYSFRCRRLPKQCADNETAPTEELPRAVRWMIRLKVPRSVPRLLPCLGRYRPQVGWQIECRVECFLRCHLR